MADSSHHRHRSQSRLRLRRRPVEEKRRFNLFNDTTHKMIHHLSRDSWFRRAASYIRYSISKIRDENIRTFSPRQRAEA